MDIKFWEKTVISKEGGYMINVTWIGVNKKEITDENIQKVEQYFKIKFPMDFVECVKNMIVVIQD